MKIRIAIHSRTKECIAALSLSCRFAFPPVPPLGRYAGAGTYHARDSFRFRSILFFRLCHSSSRYLAAVLYHLCSSYRDLRFDPSWYSSCTHVVGTRTSSHIGSLVVWVHRWSPFYPDDTMLRFLKKRIKHKKSPEPPQLGIPAKITGIPPGFRADLDIAPEGE